jgi:hypothetical protein
MEEDDVYSINYEEWRFKQFAACSLGTRKSR